MELRCYSRHRLTRRGGFAQQRGQTPYPRCTVDLSSMDRGSDPFVGQCPPRMSDAGQSGYRVCLNPRSKSQSSGESCDSHEQHSLDSHQSPDEHSDHLAATHFQITAPPLQFG